MLKRLPYADEPAIPALVLLGGLAPILWIRSLGYVDPSGSVADRWVYIFGMGLALALLAVGLAGLRFVRISAVSGSEETDRSSRALTAAILVSSAVLVAVGGSFAVVAFALGLCAGPV